MPLNGRKLTALAETTPGRRDICSAAFAKKSTRFCSSLYPPLSRVTRKVRTLAGSGRPVSGFVTSGRENSLRVLSRRAFHQHSAHRRDGVPQSRGVGLSDFRPPEQVFKNGGEAGAFPDPENSEGADQFVGLGGGLLAQVVIDCPLLQRGGNLLEHIQLTQHLLAALLP